jgi:Holliday junction DNA helicase RuvA
VFEYFEGRLAEKTPSHVVIDVGGVGYFVHTCERIARALPQTGERAKLWVHPHHVEGEVPRLYGFAETFERRVFRLLIGISKVGPTAAMGLLASFRAEEIVTAVVRGEGALLTRAKGVGKKTADRLVLELRESFQKIAHEAGVGSKLAPGTPLSEDLLHVLLGLGFQRKDAEVVVAELVSANPGADLETLLRLAMQR